MSRRTVVVGGMFAVTLLAVGALMVRVAARGSDHDVPRPATSVVATTVPGDGSLDDGTTESSIPGAQPGRPQLDGEPSQEPSG